MNQGHKTELARYATSQTMDNEEGIKSEESSYSSETDDSAILEVDKAKFAKLVKRDKISEGKAKWDEIPPYNPKTASDYTVSAFSASETINNCQVPRLSINLKRKHVSFFLITRISKGWTIVARHAERRASAEKNILCSLDALDKLAFVYVERIKYEHQIFHVCKRDYVS